MVGQAFHWFDGAAALSEIHRVLRPGGSLALLWNARRMEDSIHRSIEALIKPYCEEVPRHGTRAWQSAFRASQLFGPLEEVHFEHQQVLDADELEARIGSTSAVAALTSPERDHVLERVRALVGSGRVGLRYRCEVHLTRRIGR